MNSEPSNRYWRYQPVIVEYHLPAISEIETTIVFCECHFEDDRLIAWSAKPDSAGPPYGETVEELFGVLARMMVALRRWEPVRFEDLRVGMTFEPKVHDPTDDLVKLRTMFLTIPDRQAP